MGLFEIESEHFGGEMKVILPTTFPDERGSLTVTYLENEFKTLGVPCNFVRSMYTHSHWRVFRGLHFQLTPAMGKLIQVISGAIYLITVDMRHNSPTFLEPEITIVSEKNRRQVWAPAEFARGYYSLKDDTIVQYNCDEYHGEDSVVRWDDPDIGICLPGDPILSKRDAQAPTAAEFFRKMQ